jgi:hypothetical protein
MDSKPIVVFVCSGNDDNHQSYNVDAIYSFLKGDCDCQVESFRWSDFLKNHLLRLKKAWNNGGLLCVLVEKSQYDMLDEDKTIELINGSVSSVVPVLLFSSYGPGADPSKLQPTNVKVFASDNEALKHCLSLRKDWKCSPTTIDWFDVRNQEELGFLSRRLVTAYNAHHGDLEETALAPISPDHRLFAEALRMRLLPAQLVKEEFDEPNLVKVQQRSFAGIKKDVYDAEIAQIREMNDSEREGFYHSLLFATGCAPTGNGGVVRFEASRGSDNIGFAIDAASFEFATSSSFGLHAYAKQSLEYRLERLQMIRIGICGPDAVLEDVGHYIIEGLIIPKFKGFESPLLILYGRPDEELFQVVVQHILSERKYIPIMQDGKLATV